HYANGITSVALVNARFQWLDADQEWLLMKHAILGAGAVGGLVGAALASLGEDVTVIVRPETLPQYPRSLTLERPSGTITALAKPTAALTEPVDVLWIATKTY